MAENTQTYANASLYVGDLDPDVTEAQLFEKFSTCGSIVLTKICRDKITRQSLGYAYVNFSQPADAERALDTLNFELLNGKPMRIMWSNRDPALRKSGVGNVFIKNLDKTIDNKSLYDTFSTFGNIISCKIMSDETGSKGYGFVHFETQEAAEKAIISVNNMLLNGKKVFVGNFLSKHFRNASSDQQTKLFTNVYVKNFDQSVNEDQLRELFGKFGDITSLKISKNNEGASAGFGFVNFKQADEAAKAVRELNDTEYNGKKLYAGRFQKKAERIGEIKRKYEEKKQERLKKYYGVNLFVKNLDEKIDDERLKKEFSAFGNITSAKVMMDNTRSKGFGFVCYSAPEEAAKAVSEMNGRIVGTKPLYVALAQRKEERRKILTAQFRERMQNNQYLTAYNTGANPSLFYQYQNANPNNPLSSRFAAPSGALNAAAYQGFPGAFRASVPRWQINNQYQRSAPLANPNNIPLLNDYSQPQSFQQYSGADGAQRNFRPAQLNSQVIRNSFNTQQKLINGSYAMNNMVNTNRFINQSQYNAYRTADQINASKANPRFKQPVAAYQQTALNANNNVQAINVPGQEPLTITELSAAQPQQQKQMLGERLYPLIQALHPEHAPKITGMLLEIDNAELLHMLDSSESLKAKVDEAVSVLQTHQEKQMQLQQQQQI